MLYFFGVVHLQPPSNYLHRRSLHLSRHHKVQGGKRDLLALRRASLIVRPVSLRTPILRYHTVVFCPDSPKYLPRVFHKSLRLVSIITPKLTQHSSNNNSSALVLDRCRFASGRGNDQGDWNAQFVSSAIRYPVAPRLVAVPLSVPHRTVGWRGSARRAGRSLRLENGKVT